MSFPQRLLNDGETIVVTTRTHVKAMFVPTLVALIVVGVAAFASTLPDGDARTPLLWVIWVVAALLLAWCFLRPLVNWLTTTYTFTNRRFIARSGFIARKGRTIPLNRISGVDFDIGVVDRIFRCGTLVVSDASEAGSVQLHDIPQVERVQMRVAEELHQLSSRDRSDDGT
ncbi:PH domain-containing protein [Nocardioides massiliensis]|uniref:Membrane protein YdbT with pleckstrin-like domain n=1 Tax=Nocardioides massiliensis TaxID=1325935 RepID=A0ABT9NV86_9ACTN|nr:PH domain-containing protein [Nocardioides massiliensis]MDP9824221.1 putative membrane protein YdbT with pleckstrin-like domain [Nocardioides massiliensis]